ncbi:MAG: NHL repeat-containing protein [Actinomycetota bacterium]
MHSRIGGRTAALAALSTVALLIGACGAGTEEEADVVDSNQEGRFQQTATWGDDPEGVRFEGPNGLTVDGDGNVYATEFMGGRLRSFTPDGELRWEVAGSGSDEGLLANPIGVAVADDGEIFVSESGSSRVSVFDQDGTFLRAWGTPGDESGQFRSAMGIAVSSDGEVFVADFGNHRVQVFDRDGTHLRSWGEAGTEEGRFNNPIGVQIGPAGNVWVVDSKNERVQVFSPSGDVVRVFDDVGAGPEIISLNDAGEFYVASPWVEGQVRHFNADGEQLGVLAADLAGPHGTATGQGGVVYLAETSNGVIRLYERS